MGRCVKRSESGSQFTICSYSCASSLLQPPDPDFPKRYLINEIKTQDSGSWLVPNCLLLTSNASARRTELPTDAPRHLDALNGSLCTLVSVGSTTRYNVIHGYVVSATPLEIPLDCINTDRCWCASGKRHSRICRIIVFK